MLPVLVALALAAPLKVGVPGLHVVGIDEGRATFLNEHLGQELSRAGLDAITAREIATLLGIERQKQLLDCSDSGCTAELAGALGVDAVMSGVVARVGSVFQLDLKLLDARSGARRASFSARVKSEEELLEKLDEGARSLAEQLNAAMPREAATASTTGASPLRWAFLPALAVGAVAAAVGLGLYLDSVRQYGQLTGATPSMPLSAMTAQQLRSAGPVEQTAGLAALVSGVVLLAVGVVLLVLRPGDGS
ncbi:MAG: hypothetical protein IPJ65_00345 [Archangiaceae bacterium]|nr:hypothetical protein [Archangiaceae bacterium]